MKNRPFNAVTAVLALAFVLAVPCLGQEATPAAKPVSPAPADAAPPPSTVSPDYIIGPGDSVQVFVWRNPELSVSVPVRPDGKISTPLVEDMVAVGKTPTMLARDIEKVLAEYVRSPQVNIIINQAANAYNQVRVIGQVRTPSSVPFREGMTVLDVLLQVGGLNEFAAGNRAKLMRKDDKGKEVTKRLRLQDLISGRLSENVAVLPGDVIIVPESFF
jgi:polysaccharide biosynthesis/export protein